MARRLTIAVPTYNRSQSLLQTLDSLAALEIPAGFEAECVVVNNGSTDDTADVAARFAADSPIHTRCVLEPRSGSSYARNRGFFEARGDFVLFIDDDAIADHNWATALIMEMERRRLDAACGMVLPRWSAKPPRWLGPSVAIKLAVHDEAQLSHLPPAALDSIHNYFSANVGFRRETFARFGGFREDLGVVGNNPMSGEDTELFERIIRLGGTIGFVPTARIHHLIPSERMTRGYLRRKSYAFGFGSAVAGGRSHNRLDKLVRNVTRMMLAFLRGDHERVVFHQLECVNFLGYWSGRLHLSRKHSPSAVPTPPDLEKYRC